jgi:hypothetical protein
MKNDTGIKDSTGKPVLTGVEVRSTIGLFNRGKVFDVEHRRDSESLLLVKVMLRPIVTRNNSCKERYRIYKVKGGLCKIL